jgi:hypothetical protein
MGLKIKQTRCRFKIRERWNNEKIHIRCKVKKKGDVKSKTRKE